MTKKLKYMFISKLLISAGLIFLSIISYRKVNFLFYSIEPNELAMVIWIAISAITALLAIISIFAFRNDFPLFARISPIILTLILFAVSWVEMITNYYDPENLSLVYNIIATIGLIASICLSIYWGRNIKRLYEREKSKPAEQ